MWKLLSSPTHYSQNSSYQVSIKGVGVGTCTHFITGVSVDARPSNTHVARRHHLHLKVPEHNQPITQWIHNVQ